MKQTYIKKISLTVLATLACGAAMAQDLKTAPAWQGAMIPMRNTDSTDAVPFYSNLAVDTCTACNYDASNGYLILGPTNCYLAGSTQWIAAPFIAGHTGVLRRIQVSVTLDSALCTSLGNRFTVAIYDDNCTSVPNTQLAAATATAPAAPCALATANFRTGAPTLTAGTTYWVVCETTGSAQDPFTGVWWEANTARSPYNLNDGNGWQPFSPASPGGFSVQ